MTQGTAADFARRHVEEIINGRRLDLVDELYPRALCTTTPLPQAARPGAAMRSRPSSRRSSKPCLMSASPSRTTSGPRTADRGLCRGTISATLRGDFGPLPATGKSATAPIAEIVRIADGQIVEVWVYPDTLSIMQQFGLIPTSGDA